MLMPFELTTIIYPAIVAIIIGFVLGYWFSLNRAPNETSTIHVSELWIYPIKACKGIKLRKISTYKRGFVFDRIFMIVDDNNNMVTQRVNPKTALISTELSENEKFLIVKATGMKELQVPMEEPKVGEFRIVTVWGEECESIDMGDEAAEWLSSFLKSSGLRLVRFCDSYVRKCDPKYAPKGQTSFTDGFSFLLASTESLDDLNNRLSKPVTISRFRPNIVVTGSNTPWAEDTWKDLIIGKIKFQVVKPCSRCKVPTNDPDTGVLDPDNQPTETLKKFRSKKVLGIQGEGFMDIDVFFGQNLDHFGASGGIVQVGDKVFVKSLQQSPK